MEENALKNNAFTQKFQMEDHTLQGTKLSEPETSVNQPSS